jgi:hypothetical protein
VGRYRYRLIDAAGSELGIVEDERPTIDLGDLVTLPEEEGGGSGVVVDVYDDEEHGREGGVVATLAVDID